MIKFERNPLSKKGIGIGKYRPESIQKITEDIQEIFEEYLWELNTPEVRREIAHRIEERIKEVKAQDITSPEDMDSSDVRFRIWDSSNNELGIIKSKWG